MGYFITSKVLLYFAMCATKLVFMINKVFVAKLWTLIF